MTGRCDICYYDPMRQVALRALVELDRSAHCVAHASPPSAEALCRELYAPPVIGQVEGVGRLIWGAGTVEIAESEGMGSLWCSEIGEVSRREAARAALLAENRPGRYEPAELVALLSWLAYPVDPGSEGIRALVDGPKRGALAQAERAAALPAPIRAELLEQRITLRHAEEIAELPGELSDALLSRLDSGSFSERREIITMTVEIWKRDRELGDATGRLLESLSSKKPRERLHALRYPNYHDALARIDAFRAAQLKGSGVRLEVPPGLEGDGFALVLPFSSSRELRKRLMTAQSAAERVDEITELLG